VLKSLGTSSRLFVWIAAIALAQTPPSKLNLPYGPVIRLASPDSSRILYGVPYHRGANDEAQLWIENTHTHQRQMLLSVPSTLSSRVVC
jgi:hypothetical protein